MVEIKMLTARDLAEKAGITPVELRRLLRREFNRVGKTKVEGNRMEYRFTPNDPILKQIVGKAKAVVAEKAQEGQTAEEKPEPERAKNEGDC